MPIHTVVTFLLLAGAIGATWAQPVAFGNVRLAPWLPLLGAATVCGLLAGVLDLPAVIALMAVTGAAWTSVSAKSTAARVAAGVITVLLALALALHRLPGFHNPLLIDGVTLSVGAAPFTQYANFDKGAVGLVLLALLCQRVQSWTEFGRVLRQLWPVAVATLIAVFALGVGLGLVRPEIKLSELTLQFLAINLFFTVAAEEAFFRGFLQERLATALSRFAWGRWAAVLCSAVLFGAVHLGGGALYALLAFVAGLGYAYAYQLTRRIEAAILLHILVNGVHFIGFTYPFLKVHGV